MKNQKKSIGLISTSVRAYDITFSSVTISGFFARVPVNIENAREHLIVKIKLCPWTLGSAREQFQKIVPVNNESARENI